MPRTRTQILAIGLAAAFAGLAISPAPAGASPPGQIFSFVGGHLCLQPANGSTSQGAAIVQTPCNNGAAQLWTAVAAGGGVFRYRNSLSGLCLDARGGAANRTPVQQWTCNGISNERWEPGPSSGSDDIPPLFSRVSGTRSYCLDVPGAQPAPGLAMQIYRCNGSIAQIWVTP